MKLAGERTASRPARGKTSALGCAAELVTAIAARATSNARE